MAQLNGSVAQSAEVQELAGLACVMTASTHEFVYPRLCRAHRRAFAAELTEALQQYPSVLSTLTCLLLG